MKKTIGLITILLIMLVLLTGCVEVNYEVEVHEDGSGEVSYIYGVTKNKIGNVADLVEEFAETMREQAEENGYTVELYEDDEISGFKANKHLENLSEEYSLEDAFGEEYVTDTEENKINIEKSFWITTYSQNAELDLTALTDANITMTYKVKIPTKVTTSNADVISEDGTELTWNLTSGEINTIEFVAEQVNTLPIILIVVAILLVVIVVVVIFIILKKKHVTKKEN